MSSPLRSLLQSMPDRLEARLAPVALFATRIVFGQSFLLTGLGKLRNLDDLVEFFRGLGIPFASVQAPMVAGLEFVGGILLLLGLGTRAAAAVLSSTMVVALLTADRAGLLQAFTFGEGFANVAPVPFLVAMLWLIAKGPGRFALDHRLAARLRLRTSGEVAPRLVGAE
jgi:putative oxidoreductase